MTKREGFIPGDPNPVQGIPPELRRRHWPGNEAEKPRTVGEQAPDTVGQKEPE